MDEIVARHKKEQRDLVATVTGLKKQATKKTRKSVLQKCADLEHELEQRHAAELREARGETEAVEEELTPEMILAQMEAASVADDSTDQPTTPPAPEPAVPKRRNRQKERAERKKAEIERIRAEAAKEAEGAVDYRQIEADNMAALCQHQGLTVFDIQPDGHCLFASMADQLAQRRQLEVDIDTLRRQAGDYILAHPDDFVPFLFDETTMSLRDVGDYVAELTSTAMWGSDMEIMALAKVYEVAVEVHQAGADTLVINEDARDDDTLKLGYFKHSYGLGEHYNSLRDAPH
ncbi:hypothetical protein DICA4_D26544 [Diutina catenulata]